MSDSRKSASEPSSSREKKREVRSDASNHSRHKTVPKSGRPSYDDYARRVCQVLRWTPFQLEECTSLAQLPGVLQRVRQKPTAMLPLGAALRSLLDEAVHDVEQMAADGEDTTSQRLVTFLQIWYRERGTVVRVAEVLGLTRTHVAHQVQRPALELVARRFLDLAWRTQRIA
jgi:hypothetical protein